MTKPSKAEESKRKTRKIVRKPMSDHDWTNDRLWDDRKEFADTVRAFNWGICRELQERESPIVLKHNSDEVDRLSEIVRYNYLHMPNEDMNDFAEGLGETWIEFMFEFHHNLKIGIYIFTSGAGLEADDKTGLEAVDGKTVEIEYHDPVRFNPVFVADLMIGEIK